MGRYLQGRGTCYHARSWSHTILNFLFNETIINKFLFKITHWQSPHMHAYFPALNSFPSLLGDMISDAINCIGFTWASSPAATELEALMMDWLVKCLGLPEKFLGSNYDSLGGGVLQVKVTSFFKTYCSNIH